MSKILNREDCDEVRNALADARGAHDTLEDALDAISDSINKVLAPARDRIKATCQEILEMQETNP